MHTLRPLQHFPLGTPINIFSMIPIPLFLKILHFPTNIHNFYPPIFSPTTFLNNVYSQCMHVLARMHRDIKNTDNIKLGNWTWSINMSFLEPILWLNTWCTYELTCRIDTRFKIRIVTFYITGRTVRILLPTSYWLIEFEDYLNCHDLKYMGLYWYMSTKKSQTKLSSSSGVNFDLPWNFPLHF